jgi:glycosyltransferase involved in cell wall biosynthesis
MHDYVGSRPLMSNLLKLHAGKCNLILANSNSVREDVSRSIKPTSEVVTIYNALDLDRFSPIGAIIDLDTASNLPPAPPNTVKVGLIGTFAKWKGHKLFLKSIAMLPAHMPIRAYIVGGPIYQTSGSQYTLDELKAEVQQLGLGDRVGFTGFIHPTDAVIRSLDIVVHASTQPEPFGMAIVEAMACGKAVIASKSSGAAEIFRSGDVLAFNPVDPEDLHKKLLTFLEHPDFRSKIGQAARASVATVLSPSRLSFELVGIYHQLSLQGQPKTFASTC